MSSKQGDTTRQSLLTAEQREYLREHQVTSGLYLRSFAAGFAF